MENASADTGCSIRDAFKVLREMGAADEAIWPYSDADPGLYQRRPGADVISRGLSRRIKSYHPVLTLDVLRSELAARHPVAFGFQVPEGWRGEDLMTPPASGTRGEGGHAVLTVGYDDLKRALKIRNSWGPTTGENGYFWMAYDMWQNQDWVFDATSGRAV